MYYPVTDYIALALIISFLFLTLFICLLCLKHERIKKETIRQKNAHILEHGWNATEFSWFRYGQYNETGIYISMSLFRILCKYLFSEVAVQAVTELDNKAAHCHTPVPQW
ncbi:hypothetical protein QJ152_25785, partial [Escherichia coli]|nr:hypothetical protein [Escherichia coli]MDK2533578.1 hypothetical protein [Escherichia coli]